MADLADAFDHRELEEDIFMENGAPRPPGAENVEPNVEFHAEQQQAIVEVDWYTAVLWYLKAYGWYIILGVVAVAFLKNKYERRFQNFTLWKRKNKNEGLQYDADTALKRQEAMDKARRKLQEQHDEQAATFAEEKKLKNEEKRKDRIEDWERHQKGQGYRSKMYKPKEDEAEASTSNDTVKTQKHKKEPLRKKDYNPLTGDSGVCYRPSRSSGGGSDGGGG